MKNQRYPGGILNEEMVYDTTGRFIKRVRYYPNGHKSFEYLFGDHWYESFFENGRVQRKAGYGYRFGDLGFRKINMDALTLYDSIWKEDGSFDSVYHYSEASITY